MKYAEEFSRWLARYEQAVQAAFPGRVRFIGLQGSRSRGEATEESDVDMVVVLDTLAYDDLKCYENTLAGMEYRDKICGFLSGCEELLRWDTADLFQFYHDTVPLYGTLDWLAPLIDRESVRRAVHTGACNLYHACVHNAVHEKSPAVLCSLYKAAVFILQAKHYDETGAYIRRRIDLAEKLTGMDALILRQCMAGQGAAGFDTSSRLLMEWSLGLILR